MVDDITGNTCLFPCYVCNVLVHSEAERDEESYTSMYKGMHVCMYVCIYVCMYVCMLVLYRMPMSNYFTFQTIDISIRYRLLQTYNKSYSKLANLLQLLGSIMSRMYKII